MAVRCRGCASLRGAGHEVFAPTLTGQGDRGHLLAPEIGLDTHAEDVVALFDYEALADVTLVAHCYGGAVATLAAERLAGRVTRIAYLDALIPKDGQSILDLFPVAFREQFRTMAQQYDGWCLPAGDVVLDIWDVTDPQQRAAVGPRTKPFPIRCWEQPAKLPDDVAAGLPRSYIDCTASPREMFGPFAARAQEEGWDYHPLPAGHACWLTHSRGSGRDPLLRRLRPARSGVYGRPGLVAQVRESVGAEWKPRPVFRCTNRCTRRW